MHKTFNDFNTIDQLFQAWDEFKIGKRKRPDVQLFEKSLEDNLFALQKDLQNKTYRHGDYEEFYVHDPKQRHIHKANVRDRVVHHFLYNFLYEVFDKRFIYDSYSCRLEKGTHKGVKRLERFARRVSGNFTTVCFALKCDIKKFFASVDHEVLLSLITKRVKDENILWLLKQVIYSFNSEQGVKKGIPLGNLTSQIFANIYLNELDQFVKHNLKEKYYIRYADDFVILSSSKTDLDDLIVIIDNFLQRSLKLTLHERKIIIRKYTQGIDFLGYIVLPYIILPRTKTKRRILKKLRMRAEELKAGKISEFSFNQSLQSYLGFLKHANTYKLSQQIKNQLWVWMEE